LICQTTQIKVMIIRQAINDSIATKKRLLEPKYHDHIQEISEVLIKTLKSGHKILIAGNGGSAADAQHFAAELAGKYLLERRALPAIALTTNSSIVTAVGNDYGYDHVFTRKLEAYGSAGDIFFGITTSGNSANIINAMKRAKEMKITSIGLLGRDGGIATKHCDHAFIVPSDSTPRIQESHILESTPCAN
jgi:D-sedoheptulose 7-phosphate isomerase